MTLLGSLWFFRRGVSARQLAMLNVPLIALLATSGCQAPPATDASMSRPTMTFSDDFNGPAGTPPADSRWNHDVGGTGWGNNELENYTSDPANAALDGEGHLVISALRDSTGTPCWYGPCDYTSARLTTYEKFSQAYGRFEARIRLPSGRGIWPAFWLLRDNDDEQHPPYGEIDIMELLGHEASTIYGSLHGPQYDVSAAYNLSRSGDFSDDFHVFAVDWTPRSVSFSVDGNVYETQQRAAAGDGWTFDHRFYLLLNVAVGGDWPGPPDHSTEFPAHMIVDYVRVYTTPEAHGPSR